MFYTFRAIAAAVALLLIGASAAKASLIGDTVGCDQVGSGKFSCSPSTATVVDPGVEFQLGPAGLSFSVDFRANDVLITNTASSNQRLGGTILDLTDLTNAFTGASLLSTSGVTGLGASVVSFSAGTVVVDMRDGLGVYLPGATIDVALNPAAAVPEPASLTLLVAALAGLTMVARLRRG
jgi:hypothetical protein